MGLLEVVNPGRFSGGTQGRGVRWVSQASCSSAVLLFHPKNSSPG
jgi:hypothetical protein